MEEGEYFINQFCGATAAQQLPGKLYLMTNIATSRSCARELSLRFLYFVETQVFQKDRPHLKSLLL